MDCVDMAERLTDLIEGDLLPDEEEAALEHLATCENCEIVLAQTQSAIRTVADHGHVPIEDVDRQRMLDGILASVNIPDTESI